MSQCRELLFGYSLTAKDDDKGAAPEGMDIGG